MAQDTGALVHEGVIDAPLELVWDAWTTSEGLRSWLAPHADIDLRVGGQFRSNYDPAGALGDGGTIANEILTYDPPRMLSFRVAKAPDDFPFPTAVLAMWTVVYFEALSAQQTHVRVVAHGLGADDESQRMRAFFQSGNAATIRQMQERIPTSGQ